MFKWKSNQGHHGYSGNQKNVIQEQRPDIKNTTHNKKHGVTKIMIWK